MPPTAVADRLTTGFVNPRADDFFDWERIQGVWRTVSDYGELMREYDKCRASYEPWRSSYLTNKQDALDVLKAHSERDAVERCYDIQLAYEWWQIRVYGKWKSRFAGYQGKTSTYDELLEHWKTARCPVSMQQLPTVLGCGNMPDWRDDEDKAESRVLYAKYAEGHARYLQDRQREEEDQRARAPKSL